MPEHLKKNITTIREYMKRLKFPHCNNKIYFSNWYLENLFLSQNNNLEICFLTLKNLKSILEKINPDSLNFDGYLRGNISNLREFVTFHSKKKDTLFGK